MGYGKDSNFDYLCWELNSIKQQQRPRDSIRRKHGMEHDLTQELKYFFEKRAAQVRFAYLFGSGARGNQTFLSDIDIAVYIAKETTDTFDVKLSLHADLCRVLKRNDVDVVVLNTATNLILLDEIVRTGIVLYEADPEARTEFELRIIHQALDFKYHRTAVMGA